MAKIHIKVPVHAVRVRKVEAQVKPVVRVDAQVQKITHVRKDLGYGQYMVTYYFRKGPFGELLAEDYRSATHFERAIYDENDTFIGSTIGTLTEKIRY